MNSNEYYGYSKEVLELAEHYLNTFVIYNQSSLLEALLWREYSGLDLCGENVINFRDDEGGFKEVLEWWLVDKWLAEQLEKIGEAVLYADCGNYWGRTCSGQSIILDGTLQIIAQKFLPESNDQEAKTKRIAEFNDECRKSLMMALFGDTPCKIVLTKGIISLSPLDKVAICEKVQFYNDFSEDNNPSGQRDFGAFEHKGQKVFWKIDYYDRSLEFKSEDPSDREQTFRVLTILLASEY